MTIRHDEIAERLRAYRLGRGLSAEKIATRLGISRAAIYRLEKGELVKIETLERVAELLGVSMASLLGVGVEYHSNVVSYLERMRQIETAADGVLAHYEPVSFVLSSDDYPAHLREMLIEAIPASAKKAALQKDIENVLAILTARKAALRTRRPNVASVIGLAEIERFLRLGLVGKLDLPASVRRLRRKAAAREVEHIATMMDLQPIGVQIGLVEGVMPGQTFQIFRRPEGALVAVSPFRLGEQPNITIGVATVTAAPEAVSLYEASFHKLWAEAQKGSRGAALLRKLIAKTAADSY